MPLATIAFKKDRAMRIAMLLVVLCVILAQAHPTLASRAEVSKSCTEPHDKLPSACREFNALNGDGSTLYYSFESHLLEYQSQASNVLHTYVDDLESSLHLTVDPNVGFVFGDESMALKGQSGAGFTNLIVFCIDELLVVWFHMNSPEDSTEVFKDAYQSLELSNTLTVGSQEAQLLSALPSESDLPRGTTLKSEYILGNVTYPTTGSSPQTIPAPTPTASSSIPSNGQPLQMLSLSSKDAGLGNGSSYVYVEVRNNSNRLFPYVGIEATCRDAAGTVVGTGYGNATNVAPSETVVVTVIMLNVPTCSKVSVRFDALTYLS